MRCLACDALMKSVEETSRRYKTTGDFVDLCNHCFGTICDDISTVTKYSTDELDDSEDE